MNPGPTLLLLLGTPPALAISPSGVASAQAFGVPAAGAGAVAVAPGGVAPAESFGSATLATGAATLSPAGIASAEGFGGASLAVGGASVAVDVTPNPAETHFVIF